MENQSSPSQDSVSGPIPTWIEHQNPTQTEETIHISQPPNPSTISHSSHTTTAISIHTPTNEHVERNLDSRGTSLSSE